MHIFASFFAKLPNNLVFFLVLKDTKLFLLLLSQYFETFTFANLLGFLKKKQKCTCFIVSANSLGYFFARFLELKKPFQNSLLCALLTIDTLFNEFFFSRTKLTALKFPVLQNKLCIYLLCHIALKSVNNGAIWGSKRASLKVNKKKIQKERRIYPPILPFLEHKFYVK